MSPIEPDALDAFLKYSKTRSAELDAIAAANAAANAKTIADLKNLNVTPAPKVGETVKQTAVDEYMANKPVKAAGESNAAYNARVTEWYKNQPHSGLTEEQAAAGATLKFVRTGKGGEGEYKVIYPIGVKYDKVTGKPIVDDSGKAVNVFTASDNTNANNNTGKVVTGRITNSDGSVTVFYSDGTSVVIPAADTNVDNSNVNANTNANTNVTSNAPTTNIEVLKATLRGMGYNPQLIDSSASYLQKLLKEGLDYDNAVEVFLNTKEYTLKDGTKISSPFYTAYGYLNESTKSPRGASELYGFVEGTKALVEKYGLNTKFMSEDSLKKYVANGVTVADLEERANIARLKALESDTSYVEALKKLGFIAAASDLTDFYLDPNIGKSTLEQNRRTGLFASEALRRASKGVTMDSAFAKQIAAGLSAKGMTEEQIQAAAAQGYASIAENLGTTTKLTGIYDRAGIGAQRQDVLQGQIQSELQQEEFMGMASAARKRAKEMETSAFQAAPGISRYGLSQRGAAGLI